MNFPALRRHTATVGALLAAACSLHAQITVDFPAVQDSWVNDNKPTRNYGSSSEMIIRWNDVKIPYLQFQTYGITGPVISATLHVRVAYDTGTLRAHTVASQAWDESTLTFNNKPAWNTTAAGSVTFTSTGWKAIPVTASVTGNGLLSYALLTPDLANATVFSKESSYVPYLRVVFQDVNSAPMAQPDTYTVLHNTLRTVAAPGVLANDSDPNGNPISAQLVAPPANGTLALAADGSFTYSPALGFSGVDTFTYRAVDSHPSGSLSSAPATVTLNVSATGSQFTPEELARFSQDLGINLTIDQQLELAAIVKPAQIDPWRDAANARIEQHRKADVAVTVVDTGGLPLQGVPVQATLKRKTFHFGGVLDLPEFMNGFTNGISAAAYRSLVPKYFDSVGLNNALKPKQSMYGTFNNGNLTNLTNSFFPWCASNNIPVRGHLLLWPGGTFMSAPVEAKVVEIEATDTPTQAQLDELRALVDNEITTWAGMWNVYEWDVVNEVLANHRIQDILGPGEIVRWFHLAQNASTAAGRPATGRLINEYQIISGNGEGRIAPYKAEIQHLLDNNAPITGIGFQSRFKYRREDPALLYSRLEQFAGYNKDLVGTEFEVIDNAAFGFFPSENLRARMTEEIMTTYFSHPKVTGFFAWEFANTEARALVTATGTPRLNGLVWYYLNRLRYDTRVRLTTDAQGRVNFRGFKGEYEIRVETGGTPILQTVQVNADSQIQVGAALNTSTVHTLEAIEDTFAQEGTNAAVNFGNNVALHLRRPDGTNGRIAYLKFDATAVTGSVLDAKLRVHTQTEPNPVEVMLVTNTAWKETGTNSLTWNNRPPTGAVLGSASAPTNSILEIPVHTGGISTGGLLSLALGETGGSFGLLASTENTNGFLKPTLVITTGSPDTDGDGVFDVIDPDDDNDGLPDSYEVRHGLDPLSPGAPAGDRDGDGMSDLAEFAFGLSASTPDGPPVQVTTGNESVVFVFSVRENLAATGLEALLRFSTNLVEWNPLDWSGMEAAGLIPLGWTTEIVADPDGSLLRHRLELRAQDNAFLKLNVARLQP